MSSYRELYPNSLSAGDGLIYSLSNNEQIPWYSKSEDFKRSLEVGYSFMYGYANIIESFESIPVNWKVQSIVSFYLDKWEKLWRDYNLDYNPLDAYVVEEQGNNTINRTINGTDGFGRVVNEVGTNTGTIGLEETDTMSGADNIYGFNSIDAVPSTTTSDNRTNNSTETRNLGDSRVITNSGQDTQNRTDNHTGNHTISKHGNIGYSTPQKLLREDLELWSSPFFKIVFRDIYLAISEQVY